MQLDVRFKILNNTYNLTCYLTSTIPIIQEVILRCQIILFVHKSTHPSKEEWAELC